MALVLDQVSVDDPLYNTDVKLALNETVGNGGAGATVTVADLTMLPPVPLHVSV